MSKIINIHCDGSCLNNGSPEAKGGYGIVIESNQEVQEQIFGKLRKGKQTNNRAEIEALIQSLKYIMNSQYECFNIYSDSKTVVDCMTGESQRKSNRDLWQEVECICKECDKDVSIFFVNKETLDTSDSLYRFNVLADTLAFKGANALIINRR